MRTFGKVVTALAIAGAMLVAGGIGLFRAGSEAGRASDPVDDVRVDGSSLLRSGVGAGTLQATIDSLQERLRAAPGDGAALAQLGLAYIAQGRVTADPSWYPRAEGVLAESLRVDGEGNVEAVLGAGVLALARHDFEEALTLGREAERLNPHDADVHGVIGDALLELGRYDQAFETFQAMVDARPDLSSYARVSYARELIGDVPGAIAAMGMAFDAAGSPADAAWAAHRLGELEWDRGRLPDARGWYRRGLDLDPSYVPNAAGLARIAWARGETDLAIERYTDVVSRYPAVEDVAALGDLYASIGRTDLAKEQYAVVAATSRLQRANGVGVDLEIALFDADHGDAEAALDAAREEWARRQSVHVADAYAWALFVNGDLERARRLSERALALGTREATFLFHAGMIERALGEERAALRLLREALALNPHFSILHAPTVERVVEELEVGR